MEEKKIMMDFGLNHHKSRQADVTQEHSKLDLSRAEEEGSRMFGDGQYDNWYELRFPTIGPDRRSYHSTFQYSKRLYIFGGHDIREGSKDSLWMLDLRKMKDLDLDPTQQAKDCQWKLLETKGGEKPGQLAHHSSIVYLDKMYLFGGSNLENENHKFFLLDMNTLKWDVIQVRGDLPSTRDEHTAVLYENDKSMVLFGGFVKGTRTNEIIKYMFAENRWVKIDIAKGSPQPCGRSGHSAVFYQNSMYIFGGKDEENRKLNDLWKFDLISNKWTQLQQPDYTVPQVRAGHSADVYGDYMVLFGGIFEITKELNDLHLYDFKQNKWITLFEETSSPKKGDQYMTFQDESSPYSNGIANSSPKRNTLLNGASIGISPKQRGSIRKSSPPGKRPSMRSKSPIGNYTNSHNKNFAARTSTSPNKKSLNISTSNNAGASRNSKNNINGTGVANNTYNNLPIGIQLTTPTSISMMNTFIIKNADQSFDHYYYQMKKRKQLQAINNTSTTTIGQNEYGKQRGRKPAARDGHSGVIYGDYLFIFGGDRHHMPFNDNFILDIRAEVTGQKSFLLHQDA